VAAYIAQSVDGALADKEEIPMGRMPNWSASELDYLEEKWGLISIPTIANHLGKSLNAVKLKAGRSGLGRHIHSGEYITFNQLVVALGKSFSQIKARWIPRGLPIKHKKSVTKSFKIIYIKDFWEWAEQHKDLLEFSTFEVNALGEEPEWVKEKRKADFYAAKYITTPWTEDEDNRLIYMLNAFRYGYREISVDLKRTEGAIKRRMIDLKLMQRPIKAENHTLWTEAEVRTLVNLRSKGYGYEVIAEKLGTRSALAIRGKVERLVLDKARDMQDRMRIMCEALDTKRGSVAR